MLGRSWGTAPPFLEARNVVSGMKEVLEFSTQIQSVRKHFECLAPNRHTRQSVLQFFMSVACVGPTAHDWYLGVFVCPNKRLWSDFHSVTFKRFFLLEFQAHPSARGSSLLSVGPCFSLLIRKQKASESCCMWESPVPIFLSFSFLPEVNWRPGTEGKRGESLCYLWPWPGSWWSIAVTSITSTGDGQRWWWRISGFVLSQATVQVACLGVKAFVIQTCHHSDTLHSPSESRPGVNSRVSNRVVAWYVLFTQSQKLWKNWGSVPSVYCVPPGPRNA